MVIPAVVASCRGVPSENASVNDCGERKCGEYGDANVMLWVKMVMCVSVMYLNVSSAGYEREWCESVNGVNVNGMSRAK